MGQIWFVIRKKEEREQTVSLLWAVSLNTRVKTLAICPLRWAFLTLYEVQSEFHSRWFIWVGEKRISDATAILFYLWTMALPSLRRPLVFGFLTRPQSSHHLSFVEITSVNVWKLHPAFRELLLKLAIIIWQWPVEPALLEGNLTALLHF